MSEHLVTGSIDPAACCVGVGGFTVGILKWFYAVAIPGYVLIGTAILVTWQLYRMVKGWRSKRDRSQDGTHY